MNSLKSSPEDSYETYKMDAFCSFRNRTVLFCVSRRIRICCRIRHDNIRLYLSYFFRDHLIQRQRQGHKKLYRKSLVFSDPVGILLIFHLKIISVAGNENCAGIFKYTISSV